MMITKDTQFRITHFMAETPMPPKLGNDFIDAMTMKMWLASIEEGGDHWGVDSSELKTVSLEAIAISMQLNVIRDTTNAILDPDANIHQMSSILASGAGGTLLTINESLLPHIHGYKPVVALTETEQEELEHVFHGLIKDRDLVIKALGMLSAEIAVEELDTTSGANLVADLQVLDSVGVPLDEDTEQES